MCVSEVDRIETNLGPPRLLRWIVVISTCWSCQLYSLLYRSQSIKISARWSQELRQRWETLWIRTAVLSELLGLVVMRGRLAVRWDQTQSGCDKNVVSCVIEHRISKAPRLEVTHQFQGSLSSNITCEDEEDNHKCVANKCFATESLDYDWPGGEVDSR